MAINDKITCPVSSERIDNNVTRIIALFVLVIALLGIYLNNYFLFLFLTYDFATRTFFSGNGSLLRWIGRYLVKILGLKPKPINAAPRKFAAGVGLVFSLTIAAFIFLHYAVSIYVFGGILILCAFLESVFGFCAGCFIYSFFIIPFVKNPE